MTFSSKKRFIAGVVCPQCSQMDKIQVYSQDGMDYRECISCGFKDQIRIASAPHELKTRVNQNSASDQPRKVRLVDADKSSE